MEIIKRYVKEEVEAFPRLFAMLVESLTEQPSDVLDSLFHELELHNHYKGQFFTPYPICRMMAAMTINDGLTDIIADRGFVTAQEPACGSGAMVIALAEELRQAGINYQQELHVTAVDLDPRCVHMAYVQLSLMHIPAVIVHGNTITLEEFGHWHTPAHVMGFWNARLKSGRGGGAQELFAADVNIQLDLFT